MLTFLCVNTFICKHLVTLCLWSHARVLRLLSMTVCYATRCRIVNLGATRQRLIHQNKSNPITPYKPNIEQPANALSTILSWSKTTSIQNNIPRGSSAPAYHSYTTISPHNNWRAQHEVTAKVFCVDGRDY